MLVLILSCILSCNITTFLPASSSRKTTKSYPSIYQLPEIYSKWINEDPDICSAMDALAVFLDIMDRLSLNFCCGLCCHLVFSPNGYFDGPF